MPGARQPAPQVTHTLSTLGKREAHRLKLPNSEKAIVNERKLKEYLLSRTHPIGRFKAAFFQELGFTLERWDDLRSQILVLARSGAAEAAETTDYGQKYVVFGTLVGDGGATAEVLTVWILLKDDDRPRLVTVYPR